MRGKASFGHDYHFWGVAWALVSQLEDSEHAAEYSALIGRAGTTADQSVDSASNENVSDEGVGAPNIVLA
jgi:hypothetical protein|tara:strand:+ start:5357 stop:5566 length:210 start_codon:yes stop_codon:yes gene_type:complete